MSALAGTAVRVEFALPSLCLRVCGGVNDGWHIPRGQWSALSVAMMRGLESIGIKGVDKLNKS